MIPCTRSDTAIVSLLLARGCFCSAVELLCTLVQHVDEVAEYAVEYACEPGHWAHDRTDEPRLQLRLGGQVRDAGHIGRRKSLAAQTAGLDRKHSVGTDEVLQGLGRRGHVVIDEGDCGRSLQIGDDR